ncbi:SepM family pheromone-processing serine protease [Brevibacillus dissolubilis]|uniref:SepM family pheromone-processing serine protease n=1 Tax=Brevibacillus dissolubilis TaxID=1844116 RepID=UPI0011172217|nr:SepM family pheromone-processing serine protease [Brevibacillus dissolubilis]
MERADQRKQVTNRSLLWMAAMLLLLIALLYIPLPYYVIRPGSAIELQPLIQVEGGTKEEKGALMLTTVRMGEANPAWYVYAKLSPDVDIVEEEAVISHGETNEDFERREATVMTNSQQVAEAIAFERAGYKVKMEKQGVLVMGTIEDMPARGVLQIGDVITAVNGKRTRTTTDLFDQLKGKKEGEAVALTYLRESKEQKAVLPLKPLVDTEGKPTGRVGFGIRPDNKLLIEVPKKVTIGTKNIGGPSAGLMFTLEIYEQLKKNIDMTRGYRIAGTGTINPDGSVGRIGGIQHKIIAADIAGAEIFFAPTDSDGEVSNYDEAVATAKRIHTAMRVVPVKTVDDAISYLKQLKPKQT